MVIVTHQNVQFEDVSIFKVASAEEKFSLFQLVKLWNLTGMRYARMRINYNIDPNWANVV